MSNKAGGHQHYSNSNQNYPEEVKGAGSDYANNKREA